MQKQQPHKLLEIIVEGKVWGWQFYCPLCKGLHTIAPPNHYLISGGVDNPTIDTCIYTPPPPTFGYGSPRATCDLHIIEGELRYIYHMKLGGWTSKRMLMVPIIRRVKKDGMPMKRYPLGVEIYKT